MNVSCINRVYSMFLSDTCICLKIIITLIKWRDITIIIWYVVIFLLVNDRYKSHLKKRQTNTVSDTCTLAVVVDYRFYNFLLSSTSTVIDTLVRSYY